tara:strand:+ start:2326 stop:2748 length:423 start_codon:yes stop_codon:yes gene_type:complete
VKNDANARRGMTAIPPAVLQALAAMSGYEQMLEADRIASQYGVSSEWIKQQLAPPQQAASEPAPFTPGSKEAPALPSSADLLDKQNFRFSYDPSAQAAERRKSVEQAILCPSCGVALGIPAVRPIKVTCPQCLQETIFQA